MTHDLWQSEQRLAARLVSHFARFLTGIEIHPGARIGHGVFIDHGMGVVIGETARVGAGCLIYQGAVLGGTTLPEVAATRASDAAWSWRRTPCVLGADRCRRPCPHRLGLGGGALGAGRSDRRRRAGQGDWASGRSPAARDPPRPREPPDPLTELVRKLTAENDVLSRRIDALERASPRDCASAAWSRSGSGSLAARNGRRVATGWNGSSSALPRGATVRASTLVSLAPGGRRGKDSCVCSSAGAAGSGGD